MKGKLRKLSFILGIGVSTAFGQSTYPTGFRSPLDIELDVSGSFCELRSNHFHSGMDYRTQRREGLKVYAIGDGYVSRVKISAYGYGKAIYVTHPNGYTSLYAHLKSFPGSIGEYIRSEQYKQESYEIDILLAPEVLPVTKGQVIAYSGNTGSSQGAHLHFEIRDTESEETIHPVLFGIPMRDQVAPTLKSIRIYPGKFGLVNEKPTPLDLPLATDKEGNKYLKGGSALSILNDFRIGIEAVDGHNVSSFKNGLYSTELFLDGVKKYELRLDKIAFEELRFINAHLDYAETIRTGRKIEILYIQPNDVLRNYNRAIGNGLLTASDGKHEIKLVLKDVNGNTTNFSFNYTQRNYPNNAPKVTCEPPFCVPCAKETDLDFEDFRVKFAEKSLYDDLKINFKRSETVNEFGYPVYTLNDPYTAIHRNITVRIRLRERKGIPVEKLLIAYINEKGKVRSYGGKITYPDFLSAETNDLGQYTVMADTMAPVITPVNLKEGSTIYTTTQIQFKITDNLSGISSYKMKVDGKFVLLEYEYKSNLLFHVPDGSMVAGDHEVRLEVKDDRGNTASYTAHFKVI